MLSRSLLVMGVLLSGCLVGSDAEQEETFEAQTWGPYDPQPGHPTQADRDSFVTEVRVYAQEAEAQLGPPAAALVAMTANESGFGWTRIALYANNLFGWKWTSTEQAGGRGYYVLPGQPASDPNNKYVKFADRRDAVMFIAAKLATTARYKPHTDRYVSDVRAGVEIKTAVNRWIQGIAYAGYNPNAHYPATTIKFMNNYRTPSTTYSATYNLYKYSPSAQPAVWISIDSPAAGAVVRGDIPFASSVGGGTVTAVKFHTRAQGAQAWYALGEDTTAPFARSWVTDPWVTDGTYDLKAEAWNGSTLLATGVITVSVDNVP